MPIKPIADGRHPTTKLRSAVVRIVVILVFATAPAIVSVLLPGDAGMTFAAERTDVARNLPLPKRWRAQYIDEPIFNSRVYVVEAGRPGRPPVLLVHGLGQSGYQDWWEVIHALEPDYRVITLDLPGFARSERPAGELSPARYARMLDWLIRRLGLTGVNLVGHSMGGAVALYLAGEYPSRIANVVLVDAAGVLQRVAFLREVAQSQATDYDVPPSLTEYKKRLLDWGGRVVENFMISSQIDVTQVLRQSDQRWNTLLSDRPNINAAVSLLETDYSRVLDRFDLPVTIIWGQTDNVTPIRTGYLLHGLLANSAFRSIEGAGHVPMRSHPRTFTDYLRHALINPPVNEADTPSETTDLGDLVCSNRPGETVSGTFDRIVIERCPGMRLVNVKARLVSISQSGRVHLRHVNIDSETVALDIDRSEVTGTDVQVSGNPAVRVDNSRLDLAGGVLRAPGAALRVAERSTVILSVSRVDSGVHKGFLHGAILAGDAVLDNAPKLRSR